MSTTDNTAGAVFIGCLLSVLFFGATIVQTVVYIHSCHPDGWLVKAMVTLAIILDLLHTVLVTQGSYVYVIKSNDNPERLAQAPWPLLALTLVTCLNVGVVRVLFVRRIWFLSSKNRVVTGIPIIISLGAFAVVVCAGIRELLQPTLLQIENSPWIVYATTASDVVADISIAGTLWYYLSRKPTGYQRTSKLLHILSLCMIGTGAVTVIWDVLEFIVFATRRNTLLYAVFFLSVSNLYTNAALALLNARPIMRKLDNNGTPRFQFPEAEVACQRIQLPCDPASASVDDVMEPTSSNVKKLDA